MKLALRSGAMDIPTREKLILSGLYLSKYDSAGLSRLGFDSFIEAFNVIGFALGSKPASIKNYRDEFDPKFPNGRMGWHKRQMRGYCETIFEQYKSLDFDSFTGLIRSFFGSGEALEEATVFPDPKLDGVSPFAQRLITGVAAESYFESVYSALPEFVGRALENTTRYGCGYDYKLHGNADGGDYFAVEVKGLRGRSGSLSMTPKEYDVASKLGDRFFLFVVRNFSEKPFHTIFRSPLAGDLQFARSERVTVQVSWLTTL